MKRKWFALFLSVLVVAMSLLGCTGGSGDEPVTTASSQTESTGSFNVFGTGLYDANGNLFVMRGINEPHNWYKDQDAVAFKAIAETGSNTIRIVLGCGMQYSKDDKDELKRLIDLALSYDMIPILEPHDVTGSNSIDDLVKVAEYWVEMADVLKGTEDKVIVNIANEWCGKWDGKLWRDGYVKVIPMLREAGIMNTILVDAPGWSQYPDGVIKYGTEVLAADATGNTFFAVHFYGTAGGSAKKIKSALDNIQAKGLCVIVGEFGYTHSDGDVDEDYIMSYCTEQKIGYLGWSWKGNSGGVEYLDIANTWDGSKLSADWGEKLINGEYGIRKTSKKCTIFE